MARAYERLNLFDSALRVLHRGIIRLTPGFADRNVRTLPPLQSTLDDPRMLTLIPFKGSNFLQQYEKSKDVADLKSAYEHFVFLLKFHQHLISQSKDEQSVTYTGHLYGSNAYQMLMATAYRLSNETREARYLTETYGLIASGKYAWLTRNDIEPALRKSARASVLKEESVLVTRNILQKCKGITLETIARLLPDTTTKKFPFRPIPEQNGVSLPAIQKTLRESGEMLIDYYQRNGNLYITQIDENRFKVSTVALPPDFENRVRQLRKNAFTNTPETYARNAYDIYTLLLGSVALPEKQKIVICPDGILQEVAWDALVRDTLHLTTFKKLDYLLNHYTIRTVLTPAQLLSRISYRPDFYGVAASFAQSKRFTEIPFSSGLIRQKAVEMTGIVGSTLPNRLKGTGVLHLTAHVVNDSLRPYNSTMFFNDRDSIVVGALSKYTLPASLVVLNSCQTGRGTFYQSEGTIGFARGFFGAGAQSVLMTLWNVDDKTTADVLERFYNRMQHGELFDEALRGAKRDYLNTLQLDEMANPYYWAGLQLSGSSGPAITPYPVWPVFFAAGIACTILGYGLKHRRRLWKRT